MKLALLAAAWLAGIFLGSRVDAGLLPIVLLLLAALPAAILLRLLGRSLWQLCCWRGCCGLKLFKSRKFRWPPRD